CPLEVGCWQGLAPPAVRGRFQKRTLPERDVESDESAGEARQPAGQDHPGIRLVDPRSPTDPIKGAGEQFTARELEPNEEGGSQQYRDDDRQHTGEDRQGEGKGIDSSLLVPCYAPGTGQGRQGAACQGDTKGADKEGEPQEPPAPEQDLPREAPKVAR